MNVCTSDKPAGGLPSVPVRGNLYEHNGDGKIWIAVLHGSGLICLNNVADGGRWSPDGFGSYKPERWRDVTDQYCLKKAGA